MKELVERIMFSLNSGSESADRRISSTMVPQGGATAAKADDGVAGTPRMSAVGLGLILLWVGRSFG